MDTPSARLGETPMTAGEAARIRRAMPELLESVLRAEDAAELRQFVAELYAGEKRYLLRNDILSAYKTYCEKHGSSVDSPRFESLNSLLVHTQEIILEEDSLCAVVRPRIAWTDIYRLQRHDLSFRRMSARELLDIRDRIAGGHHPEDGTPLAIDFKPFYDYAPVIRDAKYIGKGAQFLNRYLSSKLFSDFEAWHTAIFRFLSLHTYSGQQLLINERITDRTGLVRAVKRAIAFLQTRPDSQPYDSVRFDLQNLGFEPGWGNTVGRVADTLAMLETLIESPDHESLEAFLSRIPMIFRVVLVSPHGFFGQEGVIGRPDSGGQIVYLLSQAKSLAAQMRDDARLAGLETVGAQTKVVVLTRLIPEAEGTMCNQRLEQIHGTDNAWILRVPFRPFNQKVTDRWISRFEIWPYLETFAVDAEPELLAEFGGPPDLIVGNYSDGCLVAYLLSRSLGVTQVGIAHALEKAKYLFSDMYWRDFESRYHFSMHYTADLIAMNAANLIISSTYQEIAGTPYTVGQYESYKTFSMTGLYHVLDGVELFSPKFNVVPPGVEDTVFFPFDRTTDRIEADRARVEETVFSLDDPAKTVGVLTDPSKPPLLTMARLDRIKNLTGLAEAFGKSAALRERCNLIIVAGRVRADQSADHEEIEQIELLHRIIDEYGLNGQIRWIGQRLSKAESGELYRVVADRHGAFAQPALFEAFGLTVLESMISGVPTFATRFGGPMEIIQDGVNGFWINPTDQGEMASRFVEFFDRCKAEPDYWNQISHHGIERVKRTYTWQIHTTRLLSLSRIYGFWNFISSQERQDLVRYLDVLFHLLYKPMAQRLLQEHLQR